MLEHEGGERPHVRSTALLGRRLRDALMSALAVDIPEWLSGHAEDLSPAREAHLAVAPLPDVGRSGADAALLGLALVPPGRLTVGERRPLHAAVERLHDGTGVVSLKLGRAGVWRLRTVKVPRNAGAKPSGYIGRPAHRCWTSVTPLALDRRVRGRLDRSTEAAAAVATACLNIGLPAPEVQLHAQAALPGRPDATADWLRPKTLAGRSLTHATLTFAEPVAGPVILGAGRFFGLGLCRPTA